MDIIIFLTLLSPEYIEITLFTPENIDEIFTYSKDKITKTIATLSRGLKETIAARAKQKLDEDTLDKNIIDTLESALGIQITL